MGSNQTAKAELLQNPKYYLALAALFRDEARFLKEWIEFYKLMGVEHFYLFDNLSKDNYMEILKPSIDEGIAELKHLTSDPKDKKEFLVLQKSTYLKVCDTVKDEVEWLIIVDTDEFLYPVKAQNITAVLKNYDDYASVSVNWRFFGSNNVQKIQSNELLIEKLFMRNSAPDVFIKYIVKPRYVENIIDPHFATLKSGYTSITENYENINYSCIFLPSNNILTINHYTNRDIDYFYSTKLNRPYMMSKNIAAEEQKKKIYSFVEKDKQYSSIYDDNILRFAPHLKKKMFGNESASLDSKIIKLSSDKQLVPLPNNLALITEAETKANIHSVMNGYGYDPHIVRKITSFAKPGETYLEIGSKYGEIALQMSEKLGKQGKIYVIENNENFSQYIKTNIFLNNITNIWTIDALAKDVRADIIRINYAGNECKILEELQELNDASSSLRIFIKWQDVYKECLVNLSKNNYIFIDIMKFNEQCSALVYQQDYKISLKDVTKNTEILIIKEDTFEEYFHSNSNNQECNELARDILFLATRDQNIDRVKYVLNYKLDLNHISVFFPVTVLYWAAQVGNLNIAKLFLEKGANTEIKSKNDLSPLYVSVQNNDPQMVKLLLDYNADTETSLSSGSTPLFAASYFGYETIVELLIKHGANKNVQVQGVNMISAALQNNHTSTAIILAGSQDNFCQLIQHSEYETKYAELCGESKLEF